MSGEISSNRYGIEIIVIKGIYDKITEKGSE